MSKGSSDDARHDRPHPARPRPHDAGSGGRRCRGRAWTYAELDRRSDELAAGFEPGSRISTLTGNTGEHVIVFFACAKAGAILHPVSWRLAPAEIAFQLDDAEPAVLLVEEELRPLAEAALALASVKPPLGPSEAAASSRPPQADDPLLLIYTSGTTGKPKGALLTHANCFWTNLSFDLATGLGPKDVVLQVLPQFHVGGWNVQSLLAWWKGARVVLERGFDAARALELIERERVTTMMGVPANYLFMSEAPGFASADLSSLRLAVVGGAPMPVALLDVWAARGVEIVQGYGLTEAAPNVLCLRSEDARRKAGSAGRPYPTSSAGSPSRVSCSFAGPTSSRATGETPRPRRRCFATGGCSQAISPSATTRATTGSAGASRKWLSPAVRTSTPPRSRRSSSSTARLSKPPWSAFRTSAGARPARPLSSAVRPWPTRSCASSAAPPRAFQGAEVVSRRRRAASQCCRQGRQGRARPDVGERMTEVVTSAAGRPLSQRGLDTRRRLLDAAEQVFSEYGYHDASIVKLTETAGVAQAPSTSTSTRRRRSSTSSCATSTAGCATR